jgi:hypothetical protein
VIRRRLFSIVVWLFLSLIGLNGLLLLLPDDFGGLLGHDIATHAGHHFRSPSHRIHDFTFGLLFGTATLGILVQLRRRGHVAGQLMALIPWIGLVLVFLSADYLATHGTGFVVVATALYGELTLLAALLHPAGRNLFRSVSRPQPDKVTLGLALVAAVPLLAFAVSNIGLQRAGGDDHVELGHYGFMAALCFTIIGVGLLTSLRPDGWRLPAWVVGWLAGLLGVGSLLMPDTPSSLGPVWAIAAIAWGAAFTAASDPELRRRATTLVRSHSEA